MSEEPKAPTAWYHGGPADIRMVLPGSETGARSVGQYGTVASYRPDRVYLVDSWAAACAFAALSPFRKAAVHLVEPIGAQEPDPDCLTAGMTIMCERARVLRSWKLSRKQRQEIARAAMDGLSKEEPDFDNRTTDHPIAPE